MGNVRDLDFSDLPEAPSTPKAKRADVHSLSFDDIPSAPLTALQGGAALASGFNRSVIAGIGGLPVATALNAADLVRAGYGAAGKAMGLLTPEQMPEPLDRSRYVGSPQWIEERISEASPYSAAMIQNPRPDDSTARMLHAAGGGMGAGMSGRPSDLAMMGASGVSGQIAQELGADPALQVIASMAPQAGTMAGAEALRRTMRGGEAGRAEMERRIRDFQAAGVDPTVGLATGNRRTQAIEAGLAKAPGGAGAMAKKVEEMQGQLSRTVDSARDRASGNYGPVAAGQSIQEGVRGYRERQQAIYEELQRKALEQVPPGMTFPANSMVARGGDTLADIPGAPNVSRALNEPRAFTQRVVGALQQDAMPQPPGSAPSRILQENGQPFATPTPGIPGGIPMEAITGLRSRIGQLAYADNPLLADANTGAMRHLYGGAKADLRNAGQLADAQRVAMGQQPGVSRGLDRADKFYATTQQILADVLEPIYKAGQPQTERSFYRIENDARNAGASVQRAMASLPASARRDAAATVIDRLGRATPGQQNAEGTAFSAQTFLTNYSRMTPEAKRGLFLFPNGGAISAKLDSIARAASHMRDANKVYSNPSGTAGAAANIGVGAGLAGGVLAIAGGNVKGGASAIAGVLGSMTLARGGAYMMTNPKAVTWLAEATLVKPERLQQHIRRLAVLASQEKNPEERLMLRGMAESFAAEFGDAR